MGDFLTRLTVLLIRCWTSCYLLPSPSVSRLIEVGGLDLTRSISRTNCNSSVLELEVDGLVGGLTN